MEEEAHAEDPSVSAPARRRATREIRPLTTDERASFVILSLYMATFCVITFVYFDSLTLMILGSTAAAAGLFLFVAAFFNTEAPEKSDSIHPLRSYLVSFFFVLLSLFLLRFVGGLISSFILSIAVTYLGILAALVVFRKAMVQVISAMLALVFLFVTFHNLDDILARRMSLRDALQQCGHAIFQIGPIQDVANMLLAGSYVTYLNRIDYRNEQLNLLAVKKVARTNDDELFKTRVLLDFVSREIRYVSDPDDGLEYAKKPIDTLIAGAGDCEDQALLLASMLESVGVKTYMAFSRSHVFVLVHFTKPYATVGAAPFGFVDGDTCYALDPADPDAVVGLSSVLPPEVERVFDVRHKSLVRFTSTPQD